MNREKPIMKEEDLSYVLNLIFNIYLEIDGLSFVINVAKPINLIIFLQDEKRKIILPFIINISLDTF